MERSPPHPSRDEIAEKLNSDESYLKASWMCQMSPVLTELASFVLCRKYGPLDASVCKQLLDFSDIEYWTSQGCDASRLEDDQIANGPFLRYLFDYLQQTTMQFLMPRKHEILLENRPKLWIGKSDNIMALKNMAIECNSSYTAYPSSSGLKPPNCTFMDMLPEL